MNLRLTSEKLNQAFYEREDVLAIARELLGKLIITTFNGEETIGRIVETEAYRGVTDRASHAYGGRRTSRTEVMFCKGGVAYVYLCYGIHHLFNVVTGSENIPHAVLIRAVEPVSGTASMQLRSRRSTWDRTYWVRAGEPDQGTGHHHRSFRDEPAG